LNDFITVPKILLAATLSVLIGVSTWLVTSVIEIDRTQESILTRQTNSEMLCQTRGEEIVRLHNDLNDTVKLVDIKAADRYTGKDAKADQQLNIQHHQFIWIAINKLQDDFMDLHNEIKEMYKK